MRKHALLFVILGSALWGTDALFRRPLTETLSPITIVLLEHCILALVMLPTILKAQRSLRRLNTRDYAALAFVALAGSVAATSLFTFSIKYGNPSVTILLQKTQPLVTILLAQRLLSERPGKSFWYWLPFALLGSYLVSTPDWRGGLSIDPRQPAVILSAIGASCLWGASTVFGRYLVARVPVLVLTGLRFLLALPLLVLLYLMQPAADRALPADVFSLLTLTGMALIAGLAALLLYYLGLQSTPASLASIGELAFPVTAVAANWFILQSRLTHSQFLGAALLLAAVTAMSYVHGREGTGIRRTEPKPSSI